MTRRMTPAAFERWRANPIAFIEGWRGGGNPTISIFDELWAYTANVPIGYGMNLCHRLRVKSPVA
jgi:hypothetical protein